MFDRIGIIGAGAIGSVVGGLLTRAGRDVTLIDQWPEHVEAMRTKGLRLCGTCGDHVVPVTALHIHEAQGLREPFDAVFVSVKSYDTEWATHLAVSYLRPPHGVVVDFQNGINDERVAAIAGRERTLGCVITIGAGLYEAGHAMRTDSGKVGFKIGELDGKDTERARAIAALMNDVAGAQVTHEPHGRALVQARRELHGQSPRRPVRARLRRGAERAGPAPHRDPRGRGGHPRGPRRRPRGGADLRRARAALRRRRGRPRPRGPRARRGGGRPVPHRRPPVDAAGRHAPSPHRGGPLERVRGARGPAARRRRRRSTTRWWRWSTRTAWAPSPPIPGTSSRSSGCCRRRGRTASGDRTASGSAVRGGLPVPFQGEGRGEGTAEGPRRRTSSVLVRGDSGSARHPAITTRDRHRREGCKEAKMLGDVIELSVVVKDMDAAIERYTQALRHQGPQARGVQGVRLQERHPAARASATSSSSSPPIRTRPSASSSRRTARASISSASSARTCRAASRI